MDKAARIFVAGHRGLVGSAILRALQAQGYSDIILRSRAELDLLNQQAVNDFFAAEKPDYVFLAAAKAGGIYANNTYPAEFIYENLAIQTHVMHAAWVNNVARLLFLGSSCVYPRLAPQPLKEESLLSGPLEISNQAYAVAKIAGIQLCASYNRQYRTRFIAAMPTNIYGPGDNYHPENSHVIPALIRKFLEARQTQAADVAIWGTGQARREFLWSDDLGEACVFLMNLPDAKLDDFLRSRELPLINIGTGKDITIAELAELIKEKTGFQGRLRFDPASLEGTPQKLLDVNLIAGLGWQPKVALGDGLQTAIQDFESRYAA